MSLRSAVAGLVATATLVAVSVNSSTAADRGHTDAQEAMDAVVREEGAPGVLGQAEDGGGVWNGAAGVADRESDRPRLPGDRFRIGSITKTFVATVVLQLEAEGRLDLDEPVERTLPGVVHGHGHDGRRITVRQLLNHTSGVHDFTADPRYARELTGPGFLAHRFDTRTARELVRTALRHPPAFAPGTDWEYSNTNYVLAGMVIEAVTGHSYAHEISQRLLRPLGLRETSLPGSSPAITGRHGRAYSTLYSDSGDSGDREVHDVTRLDPSLAGASGEMVSTTGDLIAFFRALLGGDLLPARQRAELTATVPTGHPPPRDRYGLGIRPWRLPCGTTVWGHDGGIHGSVSTAATTRDGGHAAAFNVNADWAGRGAGLVEAEFCG